MFYMNTCLCTFRRLILAFILQFIWPLCGSAANRPNILIVVADDQSWVSSGAYGEKAAQTPNMDSIARNGVRFTQAYCSAPSCAPSRASILTGRDFCTLEEGANLKGTLSSKFTVYPEILTQAGYVVAHTGKGWGPGNIYVAGRATEPFGDWYMEGKKQDKRSLESTLFNKPQVWAKNFEAFLDATPKDKSFCFWFGSNDPHRPYQSGLAGKINQSAIQVPPFLPDVPETRGDLTDYLAAIERLDRDLGSLVEVLKKRGLYENTLIIFTSDNGMPFPRAKGFLYDYGTRMPLLIQWPARLPKGRVLDDFVSLIDLAPTMLDVAQVPIPGEMTGRSLLSILTAKGDGRIDATRDHVFLGRERHGDKRIENGLSVGYPMRAVRTDKFLYIRNFKPNREPARDQDPSTDTDPGPTRTFLAEHKTDPQYAKLWQLSFAKRPAEELYDVTVDPFEMNNLAANPAYTAEKKKLNQQLFNWLKQIKDPRAGNNGDIFDTYPVCTKKKS